MSYVVSITLYNFTIIYDSSQTMISVSFPDEIREIEVKNSSHFTPFDVQCALQETHGVLIAELCVHDPNQQIDKTCLSTDKNTRLQTSHTLYATIQQPIDDILVEEVVNGYYYGDETTKANVVSTYGHPEQWQVHQVQQHQIVYAPTTLEELYHNQVVYNSIDWDTICKYEKYDYVCRVQFKHYTQKTRAIQLVSLNHLNLKANGFVHSQQSNKQRKHRKKNKMDNLLFHQIHLGPCVLPRKPTQQIWVYSVSYNQINQNNQNNQNKL